jgi:mRNA-degrading endonuclease HigB of HigAB toxin-antitoxin module
VNVIALKTLRAFWRKHPEAKTSLRVWRKLLTKTKPQNFHELKDTFNSDPGPSATQARRCWCGVKTGAAVGSRSADYSDPYTIFLLTRRHLTGRSRFDVGGNNYRVIVVMVYLGRAAFIKKVFTHPEYMKWNAQRKKGKA